MFLAQIAVIRQEQRAGNLESVEVRIRAHFC